MLKIGFIGAGNLATAMIEGITKSLANEVEISAYDIDLQKRENLKHLDVKIAEDISEICSNDFIIMAVKPNKIKEVCLSLVDKIKEEQNIITVAAGVPLEAYKMWLPQGKIVRTMPNTASAVGHSITGLMCNEVLSTEEKENVEKIFSAIGSFVWIDEKDVDALCAVSGSGPAYVYYLAEVMAEAGERLGLDKELSEKLAKETIIGAGKMLEASTKSPKELRIQVTSPNGTTEQALNVLTKELPNTFFEAMAKCSNRSKEMGEESLKK